MSEVLSSWSRRRAAVAAEAAQDERAAQEAVHIEEQAALAEKSDEDILEELGLPDPDSLVQGDDFKAFMSKTVPQHLRKRALRKLWRSNPVLACVDGLNDYDDDYLTQGLDQGVIKTSYQVGKGMLAHLVEMERQKEAAAIVANVDVEIEETEALEIHDDVAEAQDAAPQDTTPVDVAEDSEDLATYTPRRMQFHFQEDTI